MEEVKCSVCGGPLGDCAPGEKVIKKNIGEGVGRMCFLCYTRKRKQQKRDKKIKKAVDVLISQNKLDEIFNSGNYAAFIESMSEFSKNVELINIRISALIKQIRLLDHKKARFVDLIIHANDLAATIPGLRYPDARKEANAKCSDPAFRASVFKAKGFLCAHCGTQKNLTIDHIIPVVLGGSSDMENLQILCRPCNSRKGSKDTTYKAA